MLNKAKKFLGKLAARQKERRSFSFSRPLVLLHSDDWGRVGVRDRQGYEQLRASGAQLGDRSYDLYTMETQEDVHAIRDCLKLHRDSTGRPACLQMNFLMANLDFPRMQAEEYEALHLLPLQEGLPGKWQRPGLLDAYHWGIQEGVFQPALHGLTHFCEAAVKSALSRKEERTNFLRTLWAAETPYIYWRMPWIGYEYCNPTGPQVGFLSFAEQIEKIQETARLFKKFFGRQSTSACAPGYRANADTHAAWFEAGIRVAQKGSESAQLPYFDASNLLNLYRTIDLEPSDRDLNSEEYLEIAARCFDRGMPAVISVHAINFQSTLKDFRSLTLARLDQLLTALENNFPELLYLHDEDLYNVVTRGQYPSAQGTVMVDRDLRDSTRDRGAGTYACL